MRFKTEVSDQFQFLSETYKYNDHQTHCIVDFDNKINKEVLKKSVILMLDIVPILACAYVENKKSAYWEKIDKFKCEDVIIFVDNKEEFNNFMTSKTNEFTGPQIKVCLLDSNKDSLAIIINHMVCDGGGLKQCLYLLSDLYSKLIENTEYSPNYKINTNRSTIKITQEFSFIEKINIIKSLNKGMKNNNYYKFPMNEEKQTSPFVLKHKIKKERYLKIRDYCKKYNVTINDVFLATYYRVLYRILDINVEKPLTIPIMVDMRRCLKKEKIDSVCNCTSSIVTGINYELNDSFNDTVKKVNEYMILKKNKFMGIELFFKVSLISKLFSHKKIKILMKKFENPFICMSNTGVIDSEKFSFKGMSINDVSIFGSIKYPPYFQLVLSGYNNTINLNVSLYGTSKDKENIEKFFKLMDMELPT
ncbi:siderophore synthetase [Clostridium saccharoperbutylacetonicum]|uniref:siderophore synthetase n=1 Tax=Clostridium saccharoperbutylacetonicum TaxID=36745 RepID=UPI0039EA6774